MQSEWSGRQWSAATYSYNYDGKGAPHGAAVEHEQTRSHEIIRSVGSGPNATKLYTKVTTTYSDVTS